MSTMSPPPGSDGPDLAGLVPIFVHLSDKSRRQGLLSLEEEMDNLPNEVFRSAVVEVVDGSPPDHIGQLLDFRMEELRERREAELRRELTYLRLIKTGVLAVQRGQPPRVVRDLLEAQLSPADRARARDALETWKPAPMEPPSPRPDAPGWTADDVQNLTLESVLKLSQRDLIHVTRQLQRKDVCLALRGASDDVRDRFLRAMSTRAAIQVREDIEAMGPQRVSAIEEAKQKIVGIMREAAQAHRIGAPIPQPQS